MGCCCGSDMTAMVPASWYAQFKALRLKDGEIKRLLHLYQTMDHDRSGAIDLRELLMHLEIENTDFTRRAFSVFDLNGSGKIDFREFVLSVWNYCTLGHATLDIFAFDLYDQDQSGELSPTEVERMLKDLYGKTFHTNKRAHAVASEIKKLERQGNFDLKAFTKFNKTHQELLFPAFQMQMKIQDKVLGRGFWERASNRRIELSKGKYASITQIMQMHVSPEHFDKTSNGKVFSNMSAQGKLAMQVTGTAHQRIKPQPQPSPSSHDYGQVAATNYPHA